MSAELDGGMSPPGYNTDDERPPYATTEQVRAACCLVCDAQQQSRMEIRQTVNADTVQVVAIREAVEDIARLETAVASGRAQPGEIDRLKHAADHAASA